VQKRKRRLIVRDWFFYVVWFVRLRKIFRKIYIEGVSSKETSKVGKLEMNKDDKNIEIA
jgi:hypothetical protein